LHTPSFGSAAALLVSAVICSIWPSGRPPQTASTGAHAPVDRDRALTGHVHSAGALGQAASLPGFVPSQTPPARIPRIGVPATEQVHRQSAPDIQVAPYEFPEGRALMHWMVYLELRQAAGRTQHGRPAGG
jgi:hypothetical protein